MALAICLRCWGREFGMRGIDVSRFGAWSRRAFTQRTLAALAAGCSAPLHPFTDFIVHGGPIYTGVAAAPVEAVLGRRDRIVFAGPLSEAMSRASKPAMFDLKGA